VIRVVRTTDPDVTNVVPRVLDLALQRKDVPGGVLVPVRMERMAQEGKRAFPRLRRGPR
jgi:hypothetical protein